ncbi:MAG: hypothetical protein WCV84_02165 [Patescibacteria group bacterium]
MPTPIHTIALFPKIQADTSAAIYILRSFGEESFPGISSAEIVFWTAIPDGKTAEQVEREGVLTVDLGGMFDHHLANKTSGKRTECASTIIARALGVEDHPALKKLLTWAKRDDLEGKGTISADPLDRAFGLSGIIMNLNREFRDDPRQALDIVMTILAVHVREEFRRQIELPQEWEQLEQQGKAECFALQQGSAELNAAIVESDNSALAGFLRAAKKIDLVIQRRTTNHTNIITQQLRSIDLQPVIAALRVAEADKKGVQLSASKEELMGSGRLDPIDEWYYDDAANTIQNGGVQPQGVTPTRLSKDEVIAIVKDAIPLGRIGSLKRQRTQETAAS